MQPGKPNQTEIKAGQNKNSMKASRLTTTFIAMLSVATFTFAADLSQADREFLGGYEKVRAALASDDLVSAKKAASALGGAAEPLAASGTLEQARAAFGKLSKTAERLAAGQPGFYVMHCPMVNQDWVQTSPKVANPYGGKEMLGCGEVKK